MSRVFTRGATRRVPLPFRRHVSSCRAAQPVPEGAPGIRRAPSANSIGCRAPLAALPRPARAWLSQPRRLLTRHMCVEKRHIAILGLEDLLGALVIVRTSLAVGRIHAPTLRKKRQRRASTFRNTRRREGGLARTGGHVGVDCDLVRACYGRVVALVTTLDLGRRASASRRK